MLLSISPEKNRSRQWIAEMLHQNTDTVRSIAELVLRKTEGNPFFVNEFLRLLYDENLLTFDAKHLRWQWNIDRIQTQNITDNVVELMLLQLKRLPDSTQQILRLAACIGSEFNLDTLSIVCDSSRQTVFLNLHSAIQAGLIQPLSELDEDLLVREYKFSHDRLQQAAYVSIDESQKQVVHLQIGRNLLEKTLPERRSERVIEIVDHLNYGIELVRDRPERNEIAQLNLMAAQKATGAFTPDRTQVLKLLSAQAAIAIENAKLYSKLRASESKMAQFLEAIPVGIGIIDANGRPYYANQRGIELMGKGIDPAVATEKIAEVYQFYVMGTDRIYATENMPIIRALSGECTTVDDVEIRHNNATIPVEVWGTPIFDEQGNVAYAIATFQDITERKQTEHLLADYNHTLEQQVVERTAALQKSEATLRDREQQLRLIADALPALISYVDANRCYQFINRTYEVWFSRSCDEILGNSVRELLGETVYQKIEPYIDRVFAGQTVTMEAELPFELGKKSISSTLIPDFDRHNRVRGFYSLITDISDRKLAEAASILEERNRMA